MAVPFCSWEITPRHAHKQLFGSSLLLLLLSGNQTRGCEAHFVSIYIWLVFGGTSMIHIVTLGLGYPGPRGPQLSLPRPLLRVCSTWGVTEHT